MIPPIMRIRTRYSGETVEKLFKIPVEDHTVTNVSIFERFKCTVQYFFFFFCISYNGMSPPHQVQNKSTKIFNGEDQRIPVRELTVSVSIYKTSAFEILDKGEFSLLLSLSQMDFCIIAYYPVLIYQSILLCCHFSLNFFAAA